MIKKSVLILFIIPLILQCTKETSAEAPSSFDAMLINSSHLLFKELKSLEGIYHLSKGNNIFGTEFICLANYNTLTFIGNNHGAYLVLKVGYFPIDSTIVMSGYWRFPLNSEKGSVQFTIPSKFPASILLSKSIDSSFNLIGIYNSQRDNVNQELNLKYIAKFSEKVLQSKFKVMAHRGGGRNRDNLPYSENSLEMFKHAECFGASGIEIDVKITSDKIPIVYHDDDLNTRTTQKSPWMGDIEQYSYSFLSENIKLIRGEKIPSLEETFDTVIDSTLLEVIWLDIKSNKDVFNTIKPLIDAANKKAISKNRILKIYAGLPSDEVVASFKLFNDYKNFPSLCEVSLDLSKELNSKIWAPTWTSGISDNQIQDAHNQGIEVLSWTLDEEAVIKQFIQKNNFDAILSNYVSLIAYEFYSQK